MIKGIILDIDGVIVGEKVGFNSPWPHPDVIKKLQQVRSRGVFISLCTAKPHFAIDKIIQDAGLNNFHITDGGGVIIDSIDNVVVKKHIIKTPTATRLINTCIKSGVYTETYTVDDYYIQRSQVSHITNQHTHVLQRQPKIVPSLAQEALSQEITKFMLVAKNERDKQRIIKLFQPFSSQLTLSWGVHPIMLPIQFGIVTAPGVSKKEGAIDISKAQKVSFTNILGIGDSVSDWQFIEPCKYGAAIGNADEAFKKLVKSKGKEFSYIGPTVEENGVIDILDHFFS